MDYTKNYHLPQWKKEDRIMMDDFNRMCQDIESGIGSAQKTAETARSEAAEAAKLPYAIGSYLGDGSESRNISLGFRPSFVVVSGQPENGGLLESDRFYIATAGTVSFNLFAITDDGFWVKHLTNGYPDLNDHKRTYNYIAFR